MPLKEKFLIQETCTAIILELSLLTLYDIELVISHEK